MTTWVPEVDDRNPSMILNRPGSGFDEPDTFTLEQYRRWQQAELPSPDDPPGYPIPETVHVRDGIL
jgi:hypothetical protein